MKQFVGILFGGIILVFGGIALAWSAGMLWREIPVDDISLELTQTIRYTANEEEDVINSAIGTLPKDDDRVTARSYLIKDLTDNTVWTEYDSERLLPVASLTKLVTAVMVQKYIKADDKIEITPDIVSVFGNTAGFRAGEVFTA